jgi:hypothetical protein
MDTFLQTNRNIRVWQCYTEVKRWLSAIDLATDWACGGAQADTRTKPQGWRLRRTKSYTILLKNSLFVSFLTRPALGNLNSLKPQNSLAMELDPETSTRVSTVNRPTTDDVERQLEQGRLNEVLQLPSYNNKLIKIYPFKIAFKPPRTESSLLDHVLKIWKTSQAQPSQEGFLPTPSEFEQNTPKHSCFLCLHGKGEEQYAVQIPCFRPTRIPKSRFPPYNGKDKVLKATRIKIDPRLEVNAYESDSMIYLKLRDACFEHQGQWKQWIPFYGIVDVREVQVRSYVTPMRDSPNTLSVSIHWSN